MDTLTEQLQDQLALYEKMLLRERVLLNTVNDIFRNPISSNSPKDIFIIEDKKRRNIRITELERKIKEIKKFM